MTDPKLDLCWLPDFVEKWSECVGASYGFKVTDGWLEYSIFKLHKKQLRGPVLSYSDMSESDIESEKMRFMESRANPHIRFISGTTNTFSEDQPVTMRLSLVEQTSADIFKNCLSGGCRNRLRKAQKSALHFAWCSEQSQMNEAWDILVAIHKRHGTPMFKRSLYDALIDAELIQVGLVTCNAKAVAALALVSDGRIAWVPWCGALPEYHILSPNHISHWEAINWALDHGCVVFDFGRSPYKGGTFEFKRKWGAQPVALYKLANGAVKPFSVNYKLAAVFSVVWKGLPDWLKRCIKDSVYKWLAL